MRGAQYCLRIHSGLASHPLRRYLLVRDEDDLLGYEAASSSGASDYFAILATWLDEVCLSLGHGNRREIAKLQRVIDDLLYLYAHYEIKKKP